MLFLVPAIFTYSSLLFGLLAMIEALHFKFEMALVFIFCGVICDIVDGRLARALSASTKFGAQLDNLADITTFVVAPAFVYYSLMSAEGVATRGALVLGGIGAFFYVVSGATRLARFLSQESTGDDFSGLPVTISAATFVVGVHFLNQINHYFFLIVTLSIMMNLPMTFPSFKQNNGYRWARYIIVFLVLGMSVWSIASFGIIGGLIPLLVLYYLVFLKNLVLPKTTD